MLISCENTATDSVPLTARNFPKNIATIIEANCLGSSCHSQPTSLNDGLVLASWEDMARGSHTLNDVIPYHARLSQLFLHVNTDPSIATPAYPRMPLSRNALSKDDQRAIFDWIESGAPDKDGHILYNGVEHFIYVANQGSDYVTFINADSHRLVGAVKFAQGFAPVYVTVSSDKSTYFAASFGGIIKRFSRSSRVSNAELESELTPSEILLLPDNSKGYIANYPSALPTRFGAFDPAGMTMTKFIETDLIRGPKAFALSSDSKYLYIAGYDSDNILRIATANDSIVSNLRLNTTVPSPVPSNYQRQYAPAKLILTSDDSRLFVCSEDRQEVTVFDLRTDSIIARISTQLSPYGAALTSDGKELWVANTGSNSVSIIDAVLLQPLLTLDTIASQPRSICFTPDGIYVYIACQGLKGSSHHMGGPPPSSVIVIDRGTRKLIATIELPTLSVSIAPGF